jgi:ubiquinone/menaquinone biosynthesis C-methylase UbiE
MGYFSNPWLEIPAADYEGHMGSPQVGQLQMLSKRLGEVVASARPEEAAVLGCTTGNGFEHFDPHVTRTLLGVDINREYLAIARQRFNGYGPGLELVCADLNDWGFGGRRFDLVHAALVFEYVDAVRLLKQITFGLKPAGVLSVVLQLPVEGLPIVSRTRYTSLEKLNPLFHHYQPDEFHALAVQAGFEEATVETITLPSGKQFYFGMYGKSKDIG